MSSTGDVEGSGAAHRFTATIEKDLAKNTQKQVLTEWTSSETGNPLNWAGVLSQGGLSIRLPGESQELVRDGMRIWNENLNKPIDQILPEPNPQYLRGTEMIGSGFVSIENVELMKEFLGSEEVKNYVSGVAKGFIMTPVDIVTDVKDLGKSIYEYSTLPSELKMLKAMGLIVAVNDFHRHHSTSEEWKIIGGRIWKAVKGICQDAMTAEGQGRILGEAVLGLGISRVVKGFKVASEVVDEAIDLSKREPAVGVLEDGVCPREFGVVEKLNFKQHCPVDADDFGGKMILKDSAEFIGEYNFYNPGELIEDYVETFSGYKYRSFVTKEDIILYRAGNKYKALGEYYSFDNPISEIQTRIDKAIMHKWPSGEISVVDTVYEVKIPKNTKIHVGNAANQGCVYFGGTEQVVIPGASRIEGVEILKSYPIRRN